MKLTLRKRLIAFLTCLLLMFTTIGPATFAWLSKTDNNISHGITGGSFIQEYFHTGKGTENDPYVITRPIHYYHLVELYQRDSDFAENKYYIQLGYDFFNDGNYYVYDYDDDGNVKKTLEDGQPYDTDSLGKQLPLTNSLNMKYYSGDLAVLPIGTSEVPFTGKFNGNNLCISNLTIKATEQIRKMTESGTYEDVTCKTSDIGIFGYIEGKQESGTHKGGYIHDLFFENVTIDLTGLEKAVSIGEEHATLTHQVHNDDEVYIGYLVGHIPALSVNNGSINTNGIFENVYINNCSIIGGDYTGSPYSNYGLIGHVDSYSGTTSNVREMIDDLTQQTSETSGGGSGGQGEDIGWGGSINMSELYTRINNVQSSATSAPRLPSETTITIDEVTSERTETVTSTQTGTTNYRGYDGTANFEGYYYTRYRNSTYMYLSGRGVGKTQTITEITYLKDPNDPSKYLQETVFKIKDGTSYLGRNNTNTTSTTSANAVYFLAKDNYLAARVDSVNYYLNINTDNYTLSYSTDSSTTNWTILNNTIYATKNGVKYILISTAATFGSGSTFIVLPENEANNITYIKDSNDSYLNTSTTALSKGTQNNATKWVYNPNSKNIFTIINGTRYYLNANTSKPSVSTTANTTWNFEDNKLYITNNGTNYYLIDADAIFGSGNGWIMASNSLTDNLRTIQNSNNQYLYSTTSSVSFSTNSRTWIYNGSNGTLSTYINGNLYYVNANSNSITVSSTSNNTNWVLSNNKLYTTTSGTNYYLVDGNNIFGNGNNIFLLSQTELDNIRTLLFNGSYLNASTSAVSKGNDSNSATKWIFNGTNGQIYTYINGTKYYMTATETALSMSNSNGINWTISNNVLYTTISGTNYYLADATAVFGSGTWALIPNGKVNTIQDNNGNYMVASTSAISNGTSSNATKWIINNSKIYTFINGTVYYLNGFAYDVGIRTTSNCDWSYNGSNEFTYTFENNTYYLKYQTSISKWASVNPSKTVYYVKSSDGHYLTSAGDNGKTVASESNIANATFWEYSNSNLIVSGRSLYVNMTGIGYGAAARVEIVSGSKTSFSKENSNLYTEHGLFSKTKYYLGLDSGTTWRLQEKGNNQIAELVQVTINTTDNVSKTEIDVSNTSSASNPLNVDTYIKSDTLTNFVLDKAEKYSSYTSGTICTDYTTQNATRKTIKTIPAEYATYIPLTTKMSNLEADNEYTNLEASSQNTGYIVSSGYETGTTYRADIRVSRYSFSDISASTNRASSYSQTVDNNLIIYTRTATSNGYKKIKGLRHNTTISGNDVMSVQDLKLTKYESISDPTLIYSRDNLSSMFANSPSNIDGLHFMDTLISMDHITTAKNIRIRGVEYDTYELPESCIDFNVYSKGKIAFYSGTYFPGNNTFFSLHQIFRDSSKKHITAIKEISKIYALANNTGKYVYEYTDGTFTDAFGNYNFTKPANSLPNNSYSVVFDLTWITTPSSWIDNALYYFEIPCNSGEFALGSVKGKEGAYLMYLDIGTNGSDDEGSEDEEEEIPQPATVISHSILLSDIDYRSSHHEIEIHENNKHTLLFTLSYSLPKDTELPNGVDLSGISIEVIFKDNDEKDDLPTWCNGVYEVYIKNTTNITFDLYAILFDDDDDNNNTYPYAYELYYCNNSTNNYEIQMNDELQYVTQYSGSLRRWSRGFSISNTGITPIDGENNPVEIITT